MILAIMARSGWDESSLGYWVQGRKPTIKTPFGVTMMLCYQETIISRSLALREFTGL